MNDNEKVKIRMIMVILLMPLSVICSSFIGLIFYYIWKNEHEKKAKIMLTGFWLGIASKLVFMIVLMNNWG